MTRRARPTEQQVVELYRQKPSIRKVGAELGMSAESVRLILVRNNQPRISVGRPEIYHKTDFSGAPLELAKIIGFVEDCAARHYHRQIRVETTTTHPSEIRVFDDIFGKYGHVAGFHVFQERFSLYQWNVFVYLNRSFGFLPEYKKEPTRLLRKIVETGYEYFRIGSLTSAEGWVGIATNNGHPIACLEIYNNNIQLLKWTQRTLGGSLYPFAWILLQIRVIRRASC